MDRWTLEFGIFPEKEEVGSRSQDSVLKVPSVGATPSQLEITYCPVLQSWVSPMEAEEGGQAHPAATTAAGPEDLGEKCWAQGRLVETFQRKREGMLSSPSPSDRLTWS